MFCSNCGKKLSDDAYGCLGCGNLVKIIPYNKIEKPKEETQEKGNGYLLTIEILIMAVFSLGALSMLFEMAFLKGGYFLYGIWGFRFSVITLCLGVPQYILMLIKGKAASYLRFFSYITLIVSIGIFGVCGMLLYG